MLRNEQVLGDVLKEGQPCLTRIGLDERDEYVGHVYNKARGCERDQEDAGEDHRPAELDVVCPSPMQIICADREQAQKYAWTYRD